MKFLIPSPCGRLGAWIMVACLLVSFGVAAQNTILQPPVTPGHIPTIVTNGILKDGGSAFPPLATAWPGVVSANQQTECIYNAPVSKPYTSFCFGVTANGQGWITLQNENGAPPSSQVNFDINGVTTQFPGAAGPYLPLAGGTLTGSLNQTINNTWVGPGYPPGVNGGLTLNQQFYGAPTQPGVGDTGGSELALNSILITDQANWLPGSGPGGVVAGLELLHYYGGGAAAAGRASMLIDSRFNGTIAYAPGVNFYSGLQIYQTVTSAPGVEGATSGSGNGRGTFYALSFTAGQISSGVHAFQLTGAEMALGPLAGSTAQYTILLNMINSAPPGWSSYGGDYGIALSSSQGGFWNYGICFCNPNGTPSETFPIAATGTAINLGTGTLETGIDASGLTSTWILKGPNNTGFGAGYLSSSVLAANLGNAITFQAAGGNPIGVMGSAVSNPSAFPETVTAATSGDYVNYDTQGTTLGLAIGLTNAPAVFIGRPAITTTLLGTVVIGNPASGTPATYACFTAGGQLISSSGAC